VAGINGASAALTISDIPFNGPIGAVRVGLVSGQFIINPTYSEMRDSLLNIMVVGTADGIVMIESGAKEVKEETVVDAIEFAHTEIKKICAAINDLKRKSRKEKARSHSAGVRRSLLTTNCEPRSATNWPRAWTRRSIPKPKATTLVRDLKKKLQAEIPKDDEEAQAKLKAYYEILRERIFREQVINNKRRPDGPCLRQSQGHLG
jgi:polyribonucleotide nucleotidyltransferase